MYTGPLDLYLCDKNFRIIEILGIRDPFDFFEQNSGVFVTSSFDRVDDESQAQFSFLNSNSHEATIAAGTKVAVFTVLTPKQETFKGPIDPEKAALVQTNQKRFHENKLAPIEWKKNVDSSWLKTQETCENP